jgi:hypothetical protein
MNEGVWGTCEMMLTGENQSTWRKACRSAALFITNPTWTELGLDLGLFSERLAANCQAIAQPFS